MKIRSAADALDLLGACVPSTAFGLALELGLFWKLADKSSTVEQLAKNWIFRSTDADTGWIYLWIWSF